MSDAFDDIQVEEYSSAREEQTVREGEEEPGTEAKEAEQQVPEAHGGPLGCCMGVVIGMMGMLMITVGLSLFIFQRSILGGWALPISLTGAVICGVIGWWVGKKVYREYELSPRQRERLARLEKEYAEKQARRERKRGQTV
ncbi:hypothetical protein EI42_05959 [Thermosporothrix hazakensis]|uniref:Uncharacterized protein n=2 Tax=Thermosporothrix TaxID=768650 RepID=A0A326TT73_THEHA|nr:hypothetical protein [Thermosporothrix hazakensis]PZW19731.1 hypothetical protein EI42_05959 [Thermosporothrix hazakensis]BBH90546.1 hypothetical protein KTC_52970 [Thermosporothrix sp. COM3]GCE48599.1 hypothetical protein KTH_34680 [Thermosporothrix hazakensis]